MAQKTILRVVLASPGDVQAERDAVQPVIDELNRGIADVYDLRLEVYRWETDAYPGLHAEGGQGLIDTILKIDQSDILIGIFWTRFGREIPSGEVGTEHEIRLAAKAWEAKGSPYVMLYFSKMSVDPTAVDLAQLGKVTAFRKEFGEKGLYATYNGPSEFSDLLRRNLTGYLKGKYSRNLNVALPNLTVALPEIPYKYDVFLSYRHGDPDEEFTRGIMSYIERNGFRIAIDKRDFLPNRPVLEELERCIVESRFTIGVITNRYFKSGFTENETMVQQTLDMAQRQRRFIPVIAESGVKMPFWMFALTGIDFTEKNPLVSPFERLKQALSHPT